MSEPVAIDRAARRRERRLRRTQAVAPIARPSGGPPATAHLRPVFLFGAARSGSTFLQRLLNAFESLVVWGEHGGLLSEMARSYSSATMGSVQRNIHRSRHWLPNLFEKTPIVQSGNRAVNTIEWTNPVDGAELTSAYRDFVLRLFAAKVPADWRWGFKEIRYREPEAAFLEALFPEAQMVYLIRNPVKVLMSQIEDLAKGKNSQLPIRADRLHKFYEGVAEGRQRLEDGRAVLLHYETIAQDPHAAMRRLSAFLGQDYRRELVDALAGETRSKGLKVAPVSDVTKVHDDLQAMFKEREVKVRADLVAGIAAAYSKAVTLAEH